MIKSKFVFFSILFYSCSGSGTSEIPGHLKDLDNLTVYTADTEPVYEEVALEREVSYGVRKKCFWGRSSGI